MEAGGVQESGSKVCEKDYFEKTFVLESLVYPLHQETMSFVTSPLSLTAEFVY